MPVSSEEFKRQHMLPDHDILRQVLCTEGEIKLEVAFCPRPYYGAKAARIHALEQGLRVDVGRGAYYLRSSVPIKIDFFFSSRRRHTRLQGDWSSDVCSSD